VNNPQHGAYIHDDSTLNSFVWNNFTGNGINAEDDGVNNQWDNGSLGNYWDDYSGVDANDDGIGDTPHLISGSAGNQDNYPIWDDGFDNAVPIAINDFYSTLEDMVLNIDSLEGILDNDYDDDGDLLESLIVDLPLHGALILLIDGSFSYIPDPNSYGIDNFTYMAFDGLTYSNVATVTIFVEPVNDAPIVEAGLDIEIDEGELISLAGSFSDADPSDSHSIVWDFGDGNFAYDTLSPIHIYEENGVYTVTLTVTDDNSVEDPNGPLVGSDMLTVTVVNVMPIADFEAYPLEIYEGESVQFVFTGSVKNTPASFLWDFGDGSVSKNQNPTHVYLTSGVYPVSLTVTDIDGDISIKIKKDFIIVAIDTRLPPPNRIEPKNGAEIDEREVTFRWERVAGAVEYRIQIDDDQFFNNPIIYEGAVDSWVWRVITFTYELPEDGTYYWRVCTVNSNNEIGEWSEVWAFSIDTLLKPPELISPTNGRKLNERDIYFSWENIIEASEYRFLIDDLGDFKDPIVNATIRQFNSPYINILFNTILPEDGLYYWKVCTVNQYGDPGEWSEIWWFEIDTVLPPPELIDPINGAKILTREVTFKWARVPGAEAYRILVDDDPLFNSPRVYSAWVGDPVMGYLTISHKVDLPEDGLYFWKIATLNQYFELGDYHEEPWWFTIDTTLRHPNLIEPFEEDIINKREIEFKWWNVQHAVAYKIIVDDDPEFTTPYVYDFVVNSPFTSPFGAYRITHTVNFAEDGTYYWKVASINKYGKIGPYHNLPRSFTIDTRLPPPDLIAPRNNVIFDQRLIRFRWERVLSSIAYWIQVDDNPHFYSPIFTNRVVNHFGFGDITYNYEFNMDGTLYWRVCTVNEYQLPGEWSTIRKFTIDTSLPPPDRISPENNTVINHKGIYFKWEKLDGATWYALNIYKKDVIKPIEIALISQDSSIGNILEYYYVLPGDGVYYWKICTWNSFNVVGEWSTKWWFTIDTTLPPPFLVGPSNEAILSERRISFAWRRVTGAEGYLFQVADNPDFQNMIENASIPQTDPPPSYIFYEVTLPEDGKYYWRVCTINREGVPGRWSDLWSFSIDTTLPPPKLISPINNKELKVRTIGFVWRSVPSAEGYLFQVADNPDFQDPIETAFIPQISSSQSNIYYMVNFPSDGIYYWRVYTLNSEGVLGEWSRIATFVIDTSIW